MHANQQPLASTTYAFGPAGLPQRHVQIVDPSAMAVTSDAQGQIIYGAVSSSGVVPATQFIQTSNDSAIYTQPPVVLPQDNSQTDMEIEPIDLEEVQKIQARMPAADPTAPIGSNKNPIRIIQQGNQYITTQDVSDEHLQQIIQVLTNQALISSSGSRPTKRRHDDIANSSLRVDRTKAAQAARAALRNRTPGKSNSKKRRKKGSDEDDPDFEPEVPEEEILPFPLARRTSASGRVSKPPKHLVKDYKHLRLEDLTVKPESSEEDEHSDGGYSDYINDGGTKYPCPSCDKVYMSRSGLNRHQSSVHGVTQQQSKPRPINPYVASMRRRTKLKEAVAEATDDDLIEFVAPRLSKLISPWDHLLLRSEEGDPPLPQVPRVVLDYLNLVERARAFLGDQLELRQPVPKKRKSETKKESSKEEANTENVVESEHSQPDDNATETSSAAVENGENKIEKLEQSTALGLPCGKYIVKEPLCEDYLPRRFRSALATLRAQASSVTASAGESSADVTNETHSAPKRRALVAMETAEDDEVGATLRSDPQTDEDASRTGAMATTTNTSTTSGDNPAQGGVLTLGDELVSFFRRTF
ncbi:unnamed protein product [Echinostoma caproni]|uniref:C2H2-type domain-containing protein n=1 Tax=Echinostoma caproni TaxID=27848 RepID=A0A183AL78_9TREM|nr:unnamed protein product [Echinostoma caproni]